MNESLTWRKWKRTKQLLFREEVVPMGDNLSTIRNVLQQLWRRKARYKQYGGREIQEIWLDVGDEPSNGE